MVIRPVHLCRRRRSPHPPHRVRWSAGDVRSSASRYHQRIETARGDFGIYVVSEGGTTPYRIKFRSPGFSNLSALDHMTRGYKIGDMVAIMGSLDLVIPDIDR